MAGHWQIQQLGFDASAPPAGCGVIWTANPMDFVYADMEVRGDSMFISGGTHNEKKQKHTTAVANRPVELKIIPFRGTDGRLYIDNMGSFVEREEDGEMEFNTGFGTKGLLQRGWKRSGQPNPNAAVLACTVVEVGTMGVANPVASPVTQVVDRQEEDDAFVKITKLNALLNAGLITQAEFEAKKMDLLATI
jgi:hypothetical protein